MWIKRDISNILKENKDAIQILKGPRQCGKSSLILNLDSEFKEVSLDDSSLRQLAQADPELFLKQFGQSKLFIDEAQYAPQLFPALKRKIDLYKRGNAKVQTIVRMTGSNQIMMDQQVKESLAGRASFFELNTLSVTEILNSQTRTIQDILYTGGWPELYSVEGKSVKKYLDDYINSYIEKDIVLSAGIQKQLEFLKFIKLLAGRVGQLVEYASLSNEVGVDSKTIKEWTSILVRMGVIYLVQPFSGNLNSRLIKSPKVFFIDTGLACRLQGWTSAEPIMTSPQQGALFENLVFSEIYKLIINFQLDWEIFHWRSKDKEEIDFLVQMNREDFIFIESKVSYQTPIQLKKFPEVQKYFKNKNIPVIHCIMEGDKILHQNVPIAFLSEYLKAAFNLF